MASATDERIPPLAVGDRLSRAEFLLRWGADPEIKCAELIGGIVYLPSPVTVEHGDTEGDLGTWLGVYEAATPATAGGHDTTSFLLDDTPQPDINLRIVPEHGGTSWVEDGYLHGVPELLAEVCRSSAAYDLHAKLELYQAAKVPEYLAVLVYEQEIRWHILVAGRYQILTPDADGLWRSRIFPGLWLDGTALLAGELKQVLARLDQGLQSAEHHDFVARLVQRQGER
jgi:Uma2 family endonuclease